MSPLVSTRAGISARSYGLFGNGTLAVGDYESIATVTVGAGGSSSISFTSIPSTYKHLQVRVSARSTRTPGAEDSLLVTVNSDSTTSNYRTHFLYGNGSSVSAGDISTYVSLFGYLPVAGSNSNVFSGNIIDVLDYANTSKYKTFRQLGGFDNNGSGYAAFFSSLWMNTNAISSLTIGMVVGNIAQYSSFALYGIKG